MKLKREKKINLKRYVKLEDQFRRWIPKATAKGLPTPAVERRFKIIGKLNLANPEDRKKFGYSYLEFI